MTQTQSKPTAAPPTIELGPSQIYIKRPGMYHPLQTLVEGYTDWSYYAWEWSGDRTLYYQGRHVTTLRRRDAGEWVDEHLEKPSRCWKNITLPASYATLADAVRTYEQDREQLANIERWNTDDGLKAWCTRQSFTPCTLPVHLELPPEERQRLELLMDFDLSSLDKFLLDALYKYLAEIEKQYEFCQRWEQSKSARPQALATTESEVQLGVSA
jgi:hypothetical protein